jgi:hypothetical protein
VVTGKGKGLDTKPPTIFYLMLLLEGQGRTVAGWLQSPVTRAPRSSIELRNRKRRSRESRRRGHHGRTSTGVARFRRGVAGGGALEAAGLQARATLRCFPVDGRGRWRSSSTSRSCWWRRFPPPGLHSRRIEDGRRRTCSSSGARLGERRLGRAGARGGAAI